MMSNLNGKVALVTGASKGIGASIAKHLGAAGATVVVNYATSKPGADQTVSEITAAGGKASAVQGDFSEEADITNVFAQVKERHGKLDILVNNAGVYAFTTIEQTTAEEFHRQFNLNVLGLVLSTREALKLIGPDGGSIINIGSVVGSMPPPLGAIYSATKAAVDNLTISLSKELGPRNIRVNSLNPGMIETEGTHSAGIIGSDFESTLVRSTPLRRVGQPDDIAPVAVFLASDDAKWVSGQLLLVAGGYTS